MAKKLSIGWFSFCCSEDSTILFTELLNDYYQKWKKIVDFKVILPMQRREELADLDVAFVEGAIASREQEEKLKKIRAVSKKLVAVGACAVVGLPSGQRNNFDTKTLDEINFILTRFNYNDKVKKISDFVTVDDIVPGCPMDESIFLQVINKYLREFGII
jgi:coenzyme F420-reducing hydrogenase gamma subunit